MRRSSGRAAQRRGDAAQVTAIDGGSPYGRERDGVSICDARLKVRGVGMSRQLQVAVCVANAAALVGWWWRRNRVPAA